MYSSESFLDVEFTFGDIFQEFFKLKLIMRSSAYFKQIFYHIYTQKQNKF